MLLLAASLLALLAGALIAWRFYRQYTLLPPASLAAILARRCTEHPFVVLITGGGSGIGREMALSFARLASIEPHAQQISLTLVLWDINAAALTAVADELDTHANVAVITQQCNVANEAAVTAAVHELRLKLGAKQISVVINNAGIVTGKPLLQATSAEIERTFAVNVLAHFYIVRQVLPTMLARNYGHIVTIASTCSYFGAPGLADYCASKFAVLGFHESLRLEIRKAQKNNIHTTIVHPNAISTGMFDGINLKHQWLVPMLDPKYVAAATVDATLRRKPTIVLPPIVALMSPVVRELPNAIRDWAMDLFGASSGMDTFVGHAGRSSGAVGTKDKSQ